MNLQVQMNIGSFSETQQCELIFDIENDENVVIRLLGSWVIGVQFPVIKTIRKQLESIPGLRCISFDTVELTSWDSSLVVYLMKINDYCLCRKVTVDNAGLPKGVQGLIHLACTVPERKGARRLHVDKPLLARIGDCSASVANEAKYMLDFVGQACLSLLRFFQGKAQYRRSDLMLVIEECGPKALPIVTLVSLLVGLILAFIGAIQLRQFGAQIYVANLVVLGMAREMGAMMTAIIMAGRTGAAFAAQLGVMQVNEEIDALKTMGISAMDFLVLPRLLALTMMMPLLCIYANFMGILGGAMVGIGMLDIAPMEYYHQTQGSLRLDSFGVGFFKSIVFGVVVAVVGCMRGIQCGRSSSAVGEAATSAVVTGIVFIIVSDAILTVIYDVLNI